jgi:hypothetical protein
MDDEQMAKLISELEATITPQFREALHRLESAAIASEVPVRFASFKAAAFHYGTSKSTLYRRAAEGHIRLVKHGARTLVDMESARKYFDSLPEVKPK